MGSDYLVKAEELLHEANRSSTVQSHEKSNFYT